MEPRTVSEIEAYLWNCSRIWWASAVRFEFHVFFPETLPFSFLNLPAPLVFSWQILYLFTDNPLVFPNSFRELRRKYGFIKAHVYLHFLRISSNPVEDFLPFFSWHCRNLTAYQWEYMTRWIGSLEVPLWFTSMEAGGCFSAQVSNWSMADSISRNKSSQKWLLNKYYWVKKTIEENFLRGNLTSIVSRTTWYMRVYASLLRL